MIPAKFSNLDFSVLTEMIIISSFSLCHELCYTMHQTNKCTNLVNDAYVIKSYAYVQYSAHCRILY